MVVDPITRVRPKRLIEGFGNLAKSCIEKMYQQLVESKEKTKQKEQKNDGKRKGESVSEILLFAGS